MPHFFLDRRMNCAICHDAGVISSLSPHLPGDQGCYSPIESLVADGGRYGCDTKLPIIQRYHFVHFSPCFESELSLGSAFGNLFEYRRLPYDVQDGCELEILPGVSYFFHSEETHWERMYLGGEICTDPRVLYIMIRAMLLPRDPDRMTPEEERIVLGQIPGREESVDYLRRKGWYGPCRPV